MKLCDYKENVLYEGTVFRFRGKEPFEKSVDFMLVCYPDTESGFALYCISGYHKGKLEVCLPKEALGKTCRAVLVECGFLSNPEEERLLQEKAYQMKLAMVLGASYIQSGETQEGESLI